MSVCSVPPVDRFDSVILKVACKPKKCGHVPLVCFHVKYYGQLNKNCSNLEPNKANSFVNDPQCHIKVIEILTSVFNQWIHISRGPVCTSHVNK